LIFLPIGSRSGAVKTGLVRHPTSSGIQYPP
jgi:hypothetical protein